MKRRTQPGDPTRAVAYLRVSTEEQRFSTEVQRNEIEEWSKRSGVTVCAWFLEQLTGGAPLEDRPVLLDAIAALRPNNAGLLLALRRDRLARDVPTAVALEKATAQQGARVFTVDGVASGEDPTDVFLRHVLDAVAQLERSFISSRTRAVAQLKKSRKEVYGHAPYGFRIEDRRIVPDEREQTIAHILRTLHDQGLSIRRLTKVAAARGYVSRKGNPLSFNLVARIVRMAPNILGDKHDHK